MPTELDKKHIILHFVIHLCKKPGWMSVKCGRWGRPFKFLVVLYQSFSIIYGSLDFDFKRDQDKALVDEINPL